MTKHTPELEACARAMWNVLADEFNGWDHLSDDERAINCAAFAAGLRTLLPMSNAVLRNVLDGKPTSLASGIEAAISYIIGNSEK